LSIISSCVLLWRLVTISLSEVLRLLRLLKWLLLLKLLRLWILWWMALNRTNILEKLLLVRLLLLWVIRLLLELLLSRHLLKLLIRLLLELLIRLLLFLSKALILRLFSNMHINVDISRLSIYLHKVYRNLLKRRLLVRPFLIEAHRNLLSKVVSAFTSFAEIPSSFIN